MAYFNTTTKKRKSSGMLKWGIYAAILIVALFVFIPKYLIYKAKQIIITEIPEGKSSADSVPSKNIFAAYNFLQVAKFFPLGEQQAIEGQKGIMDFYFPLFKEDYNRLKFACVDNAISELKKQNPSANADSISKSVLEYEWRNYPDQQALEEFRAKWDIYHKNFAHSLPEYPRFIDPEHL